MIRESYAVTSLTHLELSIVIGNSTGASSKYSCCVNTSDIRAKYVKKVWKYDILPVKIYITIRKVNCPVGQDGQDGYDKDCLCKTADRLDQR